MVEQKQLARSYPALRDEDRQQHDHDSGELTVSAARDRREHDSTEEQRDEDERDDRHEDAA